MRRETNAALTCHSATPDTPPIFQKGSSKMVIHVTATRPDREDSRMEMGSDINSIWLATDLRIL